MTCPFCREENAADSPRCVRCGQSFTPATAPVPAVPSAAPPLAPVTTALVAVNVAVFVAMTVRGVSPISPTSSNLLQWGADFGPAVTHGQWWRLLTSVFVHIGILHIAMNMYVLWGAGRLVERLFGPVPFAVLYVLTGLAGSLTSVMTHPFTVGAGASGAIFGLFGGLFGYLIVRRQAVHPRALQVLVPYATTFVLGNLAIGLSSPQVDLAAHLGGLVAGIPIGALLATAPDAALVHRVSRSAMVGIAFVGLMALVAKRIPVVDDWTATVRELATLESTAQRTFAEAIANFDSKKLTADEFSTIVNTKVLAPWEQERAVVASLRVDNKQRALVNGVAAYMTDRAEAWRLWTTATLKNDADARRNALAKEIEGVRTLESVMPTEGGQAELAALLAQQAYNEEITRYQSVETEVLSAFAGATARAAANRLTNAEFVALLETKVLKPWSEEQARIEKLDPPPDKKPFVDGLRQYMALESDRFELTAQAVKANDLSLMAKAREKQVEAEAIVTRLSKGK